MNITVTFKTLEIIGNSIRGELPNQDCGSNSASGSASGRAMNFGTVHRPFIDWSACIVYNWNDRLARPCTIQKKPEAVQLEMFSMVT